MGCNSSKQNPPPEPTDDDSVEAEVESVPERPNNITNLRVRRNISNDDNNNDNNNNNKATTISYLNTIKIQSATDIASTLHSLVPKNIQAQFQDHEHRYLAFKYAMHAHNIIDRDPDRDPDQDKENDDDDDHHNNNSIDDYYDIHEIKNQKNKLNIHSSTLSAVNLSKALNLPYKHIDPTIQTLQRSHDYDDCYAKQLHLIFQSKNGTIDYNQFMQTCSQMKHTSSFYTVMYNMFQITEDQEQGILREDILKMTMSVFQMACHDPSFKDAMNDIGLDWFKCSNDGSNNKLLQSICTEWINETFNIETTAATGDSNQHVTRDQFNQWLSSIVNVTKKPCEDVEKEESDAPNAIDDINWNEGSSEEEENTIEATPNGDDVEINVSSGGTGYI
jgi:hypothetical protein